MDFLKIIAIIAFAAVFVDGQSQECSLTQQVIEKKVMACAMHDLPFMIQLAESQQQTDEASKVNFFCDHVPQFVKLVMCTIKQMSSCVPPEMKPLLNRVLKAERLTEALNFLCEDRSVLMDRCMDDRVLSLSQCYTDKIKRIMTVAKSTDDRSQLACRVIHEEEKCLVDNKGSCSEAYVAKLTGFMEKLFSKSVCGLEHQRQMNLTNSLLGSLLVHGVPQGPSLKYKTYQVIKN